MWTQPLFTSQFPPPPPPPPLPPPRKKEKQKKKKFFLSQHKHKDGTAKKKKKTKKKICQKKPPPPPPPPSQYSSRGFYPNMIRVKNNTTINNDFLPGCPPATEGYYCIVFLIPGETFPILLCTRKWQLFCITDSYLTRNHNGGGGVFSHSLWKWWKVPVFWL